MSPWRQVEGLAVAVGVGEVVGDSVGEGDSVGDDVGDSVGDDVGDSVGDDVGDSVGELVRNGIEISPLSSVPTGLPTAEAGSVLNGIRGAPGFLPPRNRTAARPTVAANPAVAPTMYGHRPAIRSRIHSVRRRASRCSGSLARTFIHDISG